MRIFKGRWYIKRVRRMDSGDYHGIMMMATYIGLCFATYATSYIGHHEVARWMALALTWPPLALASMLTHAILDDHILVESREDRVTRYIEEKEHEEQE